MSSDQDANRAGWQATGAMQWEHADGADVPVFVDADPQVLGDQFDPEELVDTDDLLLEPEKDTDNDLRNWSRQPLISKESLSTFGRQFSPLLVPLPFAAVVFLVTLPMTLRRFTFFSPLVTGIMLLALAILQGMLLYVAGSNDTIWMLYIALGYALLILAGVLAALGVIPALLTLVALILLAVYLGRRSIHPTREGHVDLVMSFEKYSHTLYPGLNLLLPWEKVTQRLNIQEQVWTTPPQRVPTSREQDVQFSATVSYQLLPEDAHLAVLTVQDWEGSLHSQVIGTIQSMVNDLTLNDFVSWSQSVYARNGETSSFNPAAATRWDRISATLCRRVQDYVAAWGVQINWVRIQDLTIFPTASGLPVGALATDLGGITQIIRPEPAARLVLEEVVPAVVKPAVVAEQPRVSAPAPLAKSVSLDTLVDFYNAVRDNAITDPAMILDIAQRFDALAGDAVQSQSFQFDAHRAANTLRTRAQKIQEGRQTGVAASSNEG